MLTKWKRHALLIIKLPDGYSEYDVYGLGD